jgi:peptidoglycan/LPS O-acetylase OafA/YrhL
MTTPDQEAGHRSIPAPDDLRTPVPSVKSTPRIPSLDGLRAVSIFLVLALHTLQRFSLKHHVPLIWYGIFDGQTGVLIFFVISGYLITTLLLQEQQKRGSISLRGFYFRRAMRILPPLYAYVGVLLLLGWARRLAIVKLDIISSLFFFHDYAHAEMWSLEHFWSLSIEEQFYLIWPFVLIYCLRRPGKQGRQKAVLVAVAVVCLSPVIRVLCFSLHSSYIHNQYLRNSYALHMHADSLMFGCLIALWQGVPQFERLYKMATKMWWLPPSLVLISDCINAYFSNKWQLPFGYTICGASTAIFLLWCVRNPSSLVGRVLNARLIMHIGVLSYSIYLWQTLFLHNANATVFGPTRRYIGSFPGNWLAVLVVASLSFYLVEKPSLRLRNRFITTLHLYRTKQEAIRAARLPSGS